MRSSASVWSSYRCVVISQRLFKRDVPGMKNKLEDNLSRLRSAAKKQHGFVKSQNYSLSPYVHDPNEADGTKLDALSRPSSIIISTWRDEMSWSEWFASAERKAISRDIEPFLTEPEHHTVLSKNDDQVFLL
jgi:heme-degrading monooxygenase HmoA